MNATDNRLFCFKPEALQLSTADFAEKLPDGREQVEAFGPEIKQVLKEAARLPEPKAAYRIIADAAITNDLLRLEGLELHIGSILCKQLEGAEKIAVFACTVGDSIRELYQDYLRQGESLKAFFADILGIMAVEKTLELMTKTLEESNLEAGLRIGPTCSPGDCGWPLSEQSLLFSLLPENCCGIRLNQAMLMLPHKSLSGIIGLGKHIMLPEHNCSVCSSVRCPYRKQ